jgi:hypothetical protein
VSFQEWVLLSVPYIKTIIYNFNGTCIGKPKLEPEKTNEVTLSIAKKET